jgi:calcineurin-like phosphoesterase family protein
MNITALFNGGVVSFSSANCNLFQWIVHTHLHTKRVIKIINPCMGMGAVIAQSVEWTGYRMDEQKIIVLFPAG